MRRVVGIACLCAVGGCASLEIEGPGTYPSQRPTASLRAPVIAPLGLPVTFDASASLDPENDPLTYVFSFEPQIAPLESPDAVVSHTFATSGLFTVRVRVIDIHGEASVAEQDVAVRNEYPDPPDFCSDQEPCVVGDECVQGVCFQSGGAVD